MYFIFNTLFTLAILLAQAYCQSITPVLLQEDEKCCHEAASDVMNVSTGTSTHAFAIKCQWRLMAMTA